MDRRYYLQKLYSFQDEVLRLCSMIDGSGFYLTGGTALARGYLNRGRV